MSDNEDDDHEIIDVPAWDPELDDDDLDSPDEHDARWRLEHASVYADIECDLDEDDYLIDAAPVVEPVVAPAPAPVPRPFGRRPTTLGRPIRRPLRRGAVPPAVIDLGLAG